MSRQQKRQAARSRAKYNKRTRFSKKEVEDMNVIAFDYGVSFALQALKEIYGWGDLRIDRVRKNVMEKEYVHFTAFEPVPADYQVYRETQLRGPSNDSRKN